LFIIIWKYTSTDATLWLSVSIFQKKNYSYYRAFLSQACSFALYLSFYGKSQRQSGHSKSLSLGSRNSRLNITVNTSDHSSVHCHNWMGDRKDIWPAKILFHVLL